MRGGKLCSGLGVTSCNTQMPKDVGYKPLGAMPARRHNHVVDTFDVVVDNLTAKASPVLYPACLQCERLR
jgi:hypothetical protein